VPPDKGDTFGTYATTTRHSPPMLTREFDCRILRCGGVPRPSPVTASTSLPRASANRWAQTGPLYSNAIFLALSNKQTAPPSMAATSIRPNHKSQNMHLCNLTTQHSSVNRHLQCRCEVSWSVLESYLLTGWCNNH